MLSKSLKNNRSLTFYQCSKPPMSGFDRNYAGGATAFAVAGTAVETQLQTHRISDAFSQLRTALIERGKIYAANTTASRAGYMAEEFVAGTYNVDVTIKKVKTPKAITDKSTAAASADITYGNNKASLKYYQNAKRSANAQLDPNYGEQKRIVPTDQLKEAKDALERMAAKNELKGRTDAAAQQRKTKELLDDRIRGPKGTGSTPLPKKSAEEFASAISKEGDKTVVDTEKIDKVLEKTGVTKKVKTAKLKNELCGLGLAVAIGAGVGLSIGFITTLAQSGINPDALKSATTEGLKGGMESGLLSAIGYGIGRTLGESATRALSGVLEKVGFTITEDISKMINVGVVGTLTIAAFSTYQFMKLKIKGMATRDALIQTGRQALFSLSILAVSIAAQCLWGSAAGIIVSVSIGIIMITYSIADTIHQRQFAESIRTYTIEKCYPTFSTSV